MDSITDLHLTRGPRALKLDLFLLQQSSKIELCGSSDHPQKHNLKNVESPHWVALEALLSCDHNDEMRTQQPPWK